MQLDKEEKLWVVIIEEDDNQLGLVNMIRFLDRINDELENEKIEDIILQLNFKKLERANSELIAQFVMLQRTLVRSNGRLQIVEANNELRSAFDVVMLDKIISITYEGHDTESE